MHTEIPSDRVNICRLRAKWPQMEAFFWATLGKVEAEREEAKALHLLRFCGRPAYKNRDQCALFELAPITGEP